MNCPNCGSELPLLAAVLAQTEVGTQCPTCWSRLRQLKPATTLVLEEKERSAPPLGRAA